MKRTKYIVVVNNVPKVVTVDAKMAEMLEKAYAESHVYGLGGNTERKLRDFFAKELLEFEQLVEENPEESKSRLFANVFNIYSNESPLLWEALQWVEKHKDEEGFSSRQITKENILGEVVGYRLNPTYDLYSQLVQDFESWSGKRLVDANLRVSFVRFLKWFYVLIK